MEIKNSKLHWVYLLGFFIIIALPLLSLPPWFSPPDWGKTIVFRIVLSILIFLFLWQFVLNRNKNLEISEKLSFLLSKKNLIFWLLISLFGIHLLATIFSLDPNFSLWGSPYRSGGFVNFAFCIIFAILTFLILKKEDWQKILNFAILIGVLVSLVAIFQWQGLFKDIIIEYGTRPPSTLGNPIMLAIYLLLLSFLTLSFGIQEKKLTKKVFYFSALFLFIFVILLTYSRAAYLGLAVGFLWFLFAYPKRLALVKVLTGILLILGIYGIYYINTQPQLPEFIQENKLLKGITGRLSIERALQNPRISGWKVSWEALKDRPILGYGPENFAIGFDKHYDPSLPGIEKIPGGFDNWWDRAHNFVFDISVTAGIPALLIYLLLFGVLFFELQKAKKKDSSQTLIHHGIQATFLAYLTANFFSFDAFSSYLISFLLIGFSLRLTSHPAPTPEQIQERNKPSKKKIQRAGLWKFILFALLVWFIWSFNIKPFQINSQINLADHLAKNGRCDLALEIMEKILPQRSFLDGYLRLFYVGIINQCIDTKDLAEARSLVQKVVKISKENTKIMPYYTRNWLLLGQYNNILMENWGEETGAEAESALEKAHQLSPKRQEVLTEWIKTNLLIGQYQRAKEKSDECIGLNEKFAGCWWLKGLGYVYLDDLEKADYYLKIAAEKHYPVKSKASWLELARAYIKIKNYPRLAEAFTALIKLEPDNAQHYASLAFVYRELGQTEEARKQALKIIELFPEYQKQAEEFLKTLE